MTETPPITYRDAADLAEQIAAAFFPEEYLVMRREELAALLTAFAAEIRRSAVES